MATAAARPIGLLSTTASWFNEVMHRARLMQLPLTAKWQTLGAQFERVVTSNVIQTRCLARQLPRKSRRKVLINISRLAVRESTVRGGGWLVQNKEMSAKLCGVRVESKSNLINPGPRAIGEINYARKLFRISGSDWQLTPKRTSFERCISLFYVE